MTRSVLVTLFALNLAVHGSVAAQRRPRNPDVSALTRGTGGAFVGAVSGSMAGQLLWLGAGALEQRPDEITTQSLLVFASATVVGSAVGAWALAGSDGRAGFGDTLVGASLGLFTGVALAWAVGSLSDGTSSGARQLGTLMVSFGVGQGALTALWGRR